jgi:hypothetical protein
MDFLRRFRNSSLALLLVLALALGLAAQSTPPPTPQAPPPPPVQTIPPDKADKTKDVPGVGIEVENSSGKIISAAEAQALFAAVDQILKFDTTDTALPAKRTVKRELASRDQVQRYLESHMKNDRDTKRMQRSAVVLKKFGLLPRDFDLQSFLIELLREQVAGYYDPKTKTVYLLNWVDAMAQRPVLAHELTHALQDQNFGLEKWLQEPDAKNLQAEVASDEQTTARQAVVEGQAMVTLMDFTLAPEQSVVNAPLLVEALRAAMMSGANSPVFQKAPLFIKEALTFPYNYGLNFERELLVHGGKEKAFAGVFRNPPQTTRQIMEPQTYLAGEKLTPIYVPDLDKLLGHDYRRFDVGSIGEFDVKLLMDEYGAKDAAQAVATQWRGGFYYAAHPKNGDPNALAVVLVAKFASADAAHTFADVYSSFVPKRYKSATAEGAAPIRRWMTEEGPVSVEVQGDTVLVLESFPAPSAAKVREVILAAK